MQRINIFHFESGLCLFDRQWVSEQSSLPHEDLFSSTRVVPTNSTNNEDPTAREYDATGVCGLLQFFFQFSREFDDGNFCKVSFEPPMRGTGRLQSSRFQPRFGSQALSAMPSKLARRAFEKRQTGLELVAVREPELNLVCAGFYRPTVEHAFAREFTAAVLSRFVQRFEQQLRECAPVFQERQRKPEDPSFDTSQLLPRFASFRAHADTLREQLQQDAAPSSPPASRRGVRSDISASARTESNVPGRPCSENSGSPRTAATLPFQQGTVTDTVTDAVTDTVTRTEEWPRRPILDHDS
ncbi:MAG: hypothetical protein MHM6MM_004722 [Cercozoa sp. M6MM]